MCAITEETTTLEYPINSENMFNPILHGGGQINPPWLTIVR